MGDIRKSEKYHVITDMVNIEDAVDKADYTDEEALVTVSTLESFHHLEKVIQGQVSMGIFYFYYLIILPSLSVQICYCKVCL